MPQLDITTYSSQIFWFAICFAILYAFVSKIIAPRITEILKIRRTVIDQDNKEASDLDDKIVALETKTAELRKNATAKYQSVVDLAVKEANSQREKTLNELKTSFENMTLKSRNEISEFVKNSEEKIGESINTLSANIKKVIL